MSDPQRSSSTSSRSGRRLRSILGKNVRALSFIPRERRFYDLFEQQAATIVRSAGLLEQALTDVADLMSYQREIKNLEHQGDGITQEIVLTLNRTLSLPSTMRIFMHLRRVWTTYSTTLRRLPIRPTCTGSRSFPNPHASWQASSPEQSLNSIKR